MATRKHYSREVKLETVKLVTERGMSRSQVARDMGIDVQTVRTWLKQVNADGERAFPGQGQPRDDEVARLRREHEQLRQERDIQKKRSASSRGCPNEQQVALHCRPCEPVCGSPAVPCAGGLPQRLRCLADTSSKPA